MKLGLQIRVGGRVWTTSKQISVLLSCCEAPRSYLREPWMKVTISGVFLSFFLLKSTSLCENLGITLLTSSIGN